jgi:hypothetical protein
MVGSVESHVSYIIGYRQSSADRLTGLEFVLSWLNTYLPETEIILVEQDEKPRLEITLPSNCKKFFVYNPGLYNRCWAFNVGVKKTEKDILVFADSDMFMSREDYFRCFGACMDYEAVNPNGNRVINVGEANPENLTYKELENRKLWTFAAGIMLLQRQAYHRIGGWDERFEGWGVEDDAISHLIRNTLSNTTLNCRMYHVDHARSAFDGKSQPNYLLNKKIYEEISALHGLSLARYLQLPREQKGDEQKYGVRTIEKVEAPPRFVYFVLTGDDPAVLKQNLESWEQTRSKEARWALLVSDGRLSDEVTEYLERFTPSNTSVNRLGHPNSSHIFRFNDCLKKMSEMDFDLCFYSDPRIKFRKAGWDMEYYRVIRRTGLGHLCFFEEKVSPVKPFARPIVKGDLICRAGKLDIQSDFFTLTRELIHETGYLDSQIMGNGRLEFLDFSLRCIRKGFNVLNNPFDLRDSEEFLLVTDHPGIVENSTYVRLTDKGEGEIINRLLKIQQPRGFIPANDLVAFEVSEKKWLTGLLEKDDPDPSAPDKSESVSIRKPLYLGTAEIARISGKRSYVRAAGKIRWDKGIKEISIGVIRNSYNLLFILRLRFLIRMMDRFSNLLIRAGVALKNIDNK